MLAICSVGLANHLVLARVVLLWENRPVCLSRSTHISLSVLTVDNISVKVILRVMTIGFAISFGAQVITMIFTLLDFIREPPNL